MWQQSSKVSIRELRSAFEGFLTMGLPVNVMKEPSMNLGRRLTV